jgi:phosphoribosylformylglycinamidine synthase
MIRRLFVEKKPPFQQEAHALAEDLRSALDLPALQRVRILLRYDVEGAPDSSWEALVTTVFAEPPVDDAFAEEFPLRGDEQVFAVEYLPGQYDQRADSAAQCAELVAHARPTVATATVYVLEGSLETENVERIKRYLINAVDSREAALEKPATLARPVTPPADVAILEGFTKNSRDALETLRQQLGLAMTLEDLAFCQQHFATDAQRDPTLTELKLLDTYWSDHCRHTTFLTALTEVTIEDSPLTAPHAKALARYRGIRDELYGEPTERPECLMDLAIIGMKYLRRTGKLDDLEVSEEINAASIVVPVTIDGEEEEWLVMFKNETHNHPTEIEPFGGAATCLGGAIRDPLSGRSYVYQAMRVTGAADPRTPYRDTLPGKLPQRKITRGAAHGYSSYGNQIGLATGLVREIYHPGYLAKRMEIGAVVAAGPRANVRREEPTPGDVIVLVGGRTGRDGVGGATGSSKEHDAKALENSAEVQKGDPVCERKLQRLFRRPEVARLIKRCNDFGAGGVSVAIGELAPSLEIDLDVLPLKYAGLDGTELALSESQERMAVVLAPEDADAFISASRAENLEATTVARVTDSGSLRMTWRGRRIVDLSRAFLDTNGVRGESAAHITAPDADRNPLLEKPATLDDLTATWLETLRGLNHCSQKGLSENFDSTIGAGSILHPFGGKNRSTPAEAMAALVSTPEGVSTTATIMSFGFDPEVSSWSPYHGAVCAVVDSVARVIASGGERSRIRLTFQEYFERLRGEPGRWGKPLAALLGALDAQLALETAAVGGKDSMSGSFHDLDVPPTLVSFALAPTSADRVISPELKHAGHTLMCVRVPRDETGLPILDELPAIYDALAREIAAGRIYAARAVRSGGLAVALAEMAFGNDLGVLLETGELPPAELFARRIGDIVIEIDDASVVRDLPAAFIGTVLQEPVLVYRDERLDLGVARTAWESPLESTFPTHVPTATGSVAEIRFEPRQQLRCRFSVAKPKVVMPVFPGTNCEYDTAKAFVAAGAQVETILLRNLRPEDVEESLEVLTKALKDAQILMLPGGFSAGDEPAGSGKFMAATLRQPKVADAVMSLLYDRDGLALGICNGFQALIKVGLLPHGEIRPLAASDPTLTYNHLGRHISCYARTKVVSRRSPWLAHCELGDEHLIAFSHGEGRFYADEAMIQKLVAADQIATQYVDADGKPTLALPENPNGSVHAVEGITSPCGRVFGKMGHSERVGPHVGINVPGNKLQPLFSAGVAFFR